MIKILKNPTTKKVILFFSGISLMLIADKFDSVTKDKHEKVLVKNFDFSEKDELREFKKIFEAEKYILNEPLKYNLHLSTPFNRKIKYIYNLENFYYMDYENYNFNKLSDLFLNIHIFIN